jgi:DNA relaxase NicK
MSMVVLQAKCVSCVSVFSVHHMTIHVSVECKAVRTLGLRVAVTRKYTTRSYSPAWVFWSSTVQYTKSLLLELRRETVILIASH